MYDLFNSKSPKVEKIFGTSLAITSVFCFYYCDVLLLFFHCSYNEKVTFYYVRSSDKKLNDMLFPIMKCQRFFLF